MRRVVAWVTEGVLYVAVAALLVVAAVTVATRQKSWTRATAQKVIAQQLANTLGMRVRLGPIEGDLWHGLTIRGISVTGPDGRDDIIVEEASVKWDLASVLRGTPITQAIRSISLTRPYVRIVQYKTGKTNVEKLIKLLKRPETKPVQALPPWLVDVHDGMIEYDLRGPKLPERPMSGKLYGINAQVDLRRAGWVLVNAAGRSDSGLVGAFTVTAGMDRASGAIGGQVGFQHAELPALARLAKLGGKVQVESGTADGEVAVYLPKGGKPEVTASLVGSGLAVRVPQIGGWVRAGTATVRATSHDLWAQVPDMNINGGSGDVQFTMSDFAKPVLDVEVSNARLYWPTIKSLALRSSKNAKLPEITAGWVTGNISAMGPADHLDVDAEVASAQPVTVKTKDGMTLAAAGAQVTASVHDLKAPAAVFEATLRKPKAENLPQVMWGGQETRPRLSGLGDVKLSGSFAKTVVATADVTVADAGIGQIDGQSLSGRVDVAWPVVHVAQLSLDAGAGEASAEVLVGADDKSVAVRGIFHDVEAEWARRSFAPHWNHRLAGVADGQISVRSHDKATSVEVLATGQDVEYENYHARSAELEYRWDSEGGSVVPWFAVQTDAGPATGNVTIDSEAQTFRVKFAAGPLDGAELGRMQSAEGLEGTVWAQGTVGGAFDKPQIAAKIAVEKPSRGDQHADAAYAQIEGDLHDMKIPLLMAAREGTVASFSGDVSNIRSGAPYADVNGDVKVKGIGLRRVMGWAKVNVAPDDLPRGLAEVNAKLSGPITAPTVEGTLRAAPVAYKDYYVTRFEGPFKYSGDRIDLGPADATVEGVPAKVTATVSDLAKKDVPAHVTVVAQTGDFQLAAVHVLQRKRLDVSGVARIKNARLEWVGNKLESATAKVGVNTMRLGDLQLEPATLDVRTEGKQVVLSPALLKWPTGRLKLGGTYDTDKRTLSAVLQAEKVEAGPVLSAVAYLLPAAMKEGDGLHKTMRELDSLSLRLVGPATGTVRITGPVDEPVVGLDLQHAALKLDGRKLPEVSLSAVYVPKNNEVRNIDLEALYGQGLITAEGTVALNGQANVTVDATALDLRRLNEWVPSLPAMSGSAEFTAQFTGSTRKPDVKGSFDVTNFAVSGARIDLVQAPIFTVQEGSIRIEDAILKRDQHEVKIAGSLPFTWDGPKLPAQGAVALTASMSNMDLDLLHTIWAEYYRSTYPAQATPAILRAETSGTMDGSLDISGTLAEPKMAGGLTLAKAGLKMPGWAHPVHDVTARMIMHPSARGTEVEIADLGAEYDKTKVAGGGDVVLRSLSGRKMLDNDWNLWLTVASPEETVAGGSRVRDLKVRIEAKNAGPGVVRVDFAQGEAKLGAGSVVVKGGVDLTDLSWAKLAENKFNLSVAMKGAQVKYGDQLDGQVDGAVAVSNPKPGEAAVIGGKIILSRAQIALKAPAGTTPALYAAPPSAPNFGLSTQVVLGQGVAIRGAGVDMPLQAGEQVAALTGTMSAPVARGQISAAQGRAALPGGILSVRSLKVGLKLDPGKKKNASGARELVYKAEVKGEAEKVIAQADVDGQIVGPVHVYLAIAGELPGTLQVKARSDPALAEEQIYAILGAEPLGVLPTGASSTSEAVSERFVSLLALGLRASVFEPVEAQLRALLGLSEFAFTFGVNQPMEVRVGKYLVKDLLVSYQRSLGTGSLEDWWLSLSYEVAPGTVVSYYSRSDGETRFMIGRHRQF